MEFEGGGGRDSRGFGMRRLVCRVGGALGDVSGEGGVGGERMYCTRGYSSPGKR